MTGQSLPDGLALMQLRYAYGRQAAVDGVSLTVLPGQIYCLLGPSGCGKTTCLRIAAGLAGDHGGQVALNGRLLAGFGRWVPPQGRRIGLVQQDLALFPHMTVAQNIGFGLSRRPDRPKRVAALIARVGLDGRAGAYPHELSGGQQQRVALARALAPDPEAMLLDEAFSSLDVALRRDMRRHTAALLRERGTPTLMVTHDPEEALDIADRIAVMRAGRIVQEGAPEELRARPASPFVMAFFGETNRLSGRVRAGRLETPLGSVSANGLDEGAAADAMILADALRPMDTGVPAEIVSVRPAPGGWRVGLKVAGLTSPLIMVTGRAQDFSVGAQLAVGADPSAWALFRPERARDIPPGGGDE